MLDFRHQPVSFMSSPALKGKAPGEWGLPEWAGYYKTFRQQDETAERMSQYVAAGYAFIPLYKNGRRLETNFKAGYHVALDLDTADYTSSLDSLMRVGTFADIFAAFAYSTPSSTPEKPKSRIVYIVETPITSAREYRHLYAALAWRTAQDGAICDPSCKDPLRVYFGSPGCDMRGNWSLLTDAAQAVLLDDFGDYLAILEAEKEAARVEREKSYREVDASAEVGLAQYRLNKALDVVRFASPGERHNERLKIGRLIGGWVAGGYLDEGVAFDALLNAAISNAPGDDGENERVCRDAFNHGMQAPLKMETRKQAKKLGEL